MENTQAHIVRTAIILASTIILLCGARSVSAADWQEKLLFNPPDSQLKLEQRGRIMIYDGLTDKQIARVLDTQFDRIEAMMFVRTIITNDEGNALIDSKTGQVIVEDDGCE
jgi:hypothetical protein